MVAGPSSDGSTPVAAEAESRTSRSIEGGLARIKGRVFAPGRTLAAPDSILRCAASPFDPSTALRMGGYSVLLFDDLRARLVQSPAGRGTAGRAPTSPIVDAVTIQVQSTGVCGVALICSFDTSTGLWIPPPLPPPIESGRHTGNVCSGNRSPPPGLAPQGARTISASTPAGREYQIPSLERGLS